MHSNQNIENMLKVMALPFSKKFGDKYDKKIMKTGIDAAKIASKKVVQKTA